MLPPFSVWKNKPNKISILATSFMLASSSLYFSTLKMKDTSSSETSADFQRTTWRYTPLWTTAVRTSNPITNSLHGGKSSFRSRQLCSYSKISQHFVVPEGSSISDPTNCVRSVSLKQSLLKFESKRFLYVPLTYEFCPQIAFPYSFTGIQ
jgi:hypothetical protein